MKKNSLLIFIGVLGLSFLLTSCDGIRIIDFKVNSVVSAGQITAITYTLKNISTSTYGSLETKFYLSYDRQVDNNDVLLGTKVISQLLPESFISLNENFLIPFNTYSGNYYLLASNRSGISINAVQVLGVSNAGIDLVPTNVFFTSSIIGETSKNLLHGVYNAGTQTSQATNVQYFLRRATGNNILVGEEQIPSIAPNHSTEVVAHIEIPEFPMTELTELGELMIKVDGSNYNVEFKEQNNDYVTPLTVQKPLPDLAVTVTNPSIAAELGGSLQLTVTLKNIGQKPSLAGVPFDILLSTDINPSDDDANIFSFSLPAMDLEFSYSNIGLDLQVPSNMDAGAYYLIVIPNRQRLMVESNYGYFVSRICLHDSYSPLATEEPEKSYENHDHDKFLGEQMDESSAIYLNKADQLPAHELLEKVKQKIKVFPNPMLEKTNLTMDLIEKSEVKIEVMNMSGMILKTFQGKYDQGYATQTLDLSWVPAGNYLVKVTINQDVFTEKVVVQ